MEKKLKINFILKGIAVFAFVAFCLLAILAGVTLPFVSNASTSDSAVASAESDCATASAVSDTFNPLDFCITLGQCNTTDTYYGFYITNALWNYVRNYDYSQSSNKLQLSAINFTDLTYPLYFVAGKRSGIAFIGYTDNFVSVPYFEDNFNYSLFTPYIVYTQGFKLSNILSDVPSETLWSSQIYVFTSIPYGIHATTVPVKDFNSRFGNFRGLSSSDFYINLDVEPILPEQVRQVTVGGGAVTNGWQVYGQSTFSNIYYFNMFDKYYTNGTAYYGSTNCGWRVYTQTSPEVKASISFEVLDTVIWSADCDFNSTADGGTVTNIRNGAFAVASNYISDFNVYKISSSDNALYVMNSKYTNIDYVDFLDTFIATQDFKNVKVPSDNSLYLKGYQSASDEYRQQGYNSGFSDGKNVGYNTGFSVGDAQGYARGLDSANTYSFLGLFGAIFDAPIKAIFGGTSTLPAGTTITDSNGNTMTLQSTTTVNRAGLLNFNLMGVNLSGFVLALFSISIIVVVIKFALAKK